MTSQQQRRVVINRPGTQSGKVGGEVNLMFSGNETLREKDPIIEQELREFQNEYQCPNDMSPVKKSEESVLKQQEEFGKEIEREERDQYVNNQEETYNHIKNLMEMTWKDLCVTASIKVPFMEPDGATMMKTQQKLILNNLNGNLKPGHFTAILGPSGSGKTTLLNFLSGRLVSNNMQTYGELYVNGELTDNIDKFSNQIAYVMQDDILLATFTPREAFKFIADMRLPDLDEAQKNIKVEQIIEELGLQKCSNTKVGGGLVRGISGGERKRTSIGVELLTNPSMIFLDEPTTGLDSSTALQVMSILNLLSKKGVNVVSTIHQPSSEIFEQFERLILIVRGNIIYQGGAQESMEYFESQGFKLPDYSNPADYYMKIMNEEGLMIENIQMGIDFDENNIEDEFKERMRNMIISYENHPMSKQLENTIQEKMNTSGNFNVGIMREFYLLLKRSFINNIREPMEIRMKFLQQVVFSVCILIVFNDLGDSGYEAIQNRNGALFFLITMQTFGGFNGSIGTFSLSRPIFLRERLNKSYGTGSYFWGKSLADVPFDFLYPIVAISIVYYAIGLNSSSIDKFLILNAISIIVYFCSSSYGFLVSVYIEKLEVAVALVPIVLLPLMILGGFFVNNNNVVPWIRWIQWLSMFKWGFQAAAINEYTDLEPFDCGCLKPDLNDPQYLLIKQSMGITDDNTCIPIPCDALAQHGFEETIGETVLILLFLTIAVRLIALFGMYVISNPKRPLIQRPLSTEALVTLQLEPINS